MTDEPPSRRDGLRPALYSVLATLIAAVLITVPVIFGRRSTAPPSPVAASAAPRIVVLSPGLADILRACDLGAQFVGRHAFDAWTDPTLPVCGDQSGINYEALIAARPTHVLLEWGQRPLPARLVELAAANGWSIKNYPLLSLADIQTAADDIQNSILTPWRAPGKPSSDRVTTAPIAMGDPALALRERFDASFAPRPGIDRAGRILLLYSATPPTALGPGSFHHQILQRLGGVAAIPDGKPFISLDAEDVLRLKPDGIVIIQPRPLGAPPMPAPRDAASLRGRLGVLATLDIPAVNLGHIALIDDEAAALPGPSLTRVGDQLAEILGSWAK